MGRLAAGASAQRIFEVGAILPGLGAGVAAGGFLEFGYALGVSHEGFGKPGSLVGYLRSP